MSLFEASDVDQTVTVSMGQTMRFSQAQLAPSAPLPPPQSGLPTQTIFPPMGGRQQQQQQQQQPQSSGTTLVSSVQSQYTAKVQNTCLTTQCIEQCHPLRLAAAAIDAVLKVDLFGMCDGSFNAITSCQDAHALTQVWLQNLCQLTDQRQHTFTRAIQATRVPFADSEAHLSLLFRNLQTALVDAHLLSPLHIRDFGTLTGNARVRILYELRHHLTARMTVYESSVITRDIIIARVLHILELARTLPTATWSLDTAFEPNEPLISCLMKVYYAHTFGTASLQPATENVTEIITEWNKLITDSASWITPDVSSFLQIRVEEQKLRTAFEMFNSAIVMNGLLANYIYHLGKR